MIDQLQPGWESSTISDSDKLATVAATFPLPPVASAPIPVLDTSIQITYSMLQSVFPKIQNSTALAQFMNQSFAAHGINTRARIVMFLAQCGYESTYFTVFEENLNYSAEALQSLFKPYFPTLAKAQAYARNPEKIANCIYANRMGNGSEASGDGWKYRGRGCISLTGAYNYNLLSTWANDSTILSNPDKVSSDPKLIVESGVWYWEKNRLNRFGDSGDIVGCTKVINGGTIGLDGRRQLFAAINKKL